MTLVHTECFFGFEMEFMVLCQQRKGRSEDRFDLERPI